MQAKKIVSIKYIGKQPTMDLEVDSPNHIFYANEIAASNSHAVAYAINGYKCAYLKANYPLEFYTAYLQGCKWKQKKTEAVKELVIDGRSNNIEFAAPNIMDLQPEPYIKNKKYICFGISSVRDVGEAAIPKLITAIQEAEKRIDKELNKWSWSDFLLTMCHKITDMPKISSKVCEALIFSGALDCFGETRHKMQFDYEMYCLLTKGEQQFIIDNVNKYKSLEDAIKNTYPPKKLGGGCHSTKRSEKILSVYNALLNPSISLMDDSRFIAMSEEKYLGISITCGKGDDTMQSDMSNYDCKSVSNGIGSKNITMVVEIARFNQVKTKSGSNPGQEMCFMDLYDKTGGVGGCVVFPNIWQEIKDIINLEDVFYIMCSRGKMNSLCIEKMEKI